MDIELAGHDATGVRRYAAMLSTGIARPSHEWALGRPIAQAKGCVVPQGKAAGLPEDWPEAMARDEYDPFNLEYDRLTFTSHDDAAKYLADATSVNSLVGSRSDLRAHREKPLIAFWAGPVGFVGVGESIALFNMQGEVDLASIPDWHGKWWSYWKEYWARKATPNPMPKDYACEVMSRPHSWYHADS